MKNTSLLLGNYGIHPFKIYTINNKNYYGLHDINHIFLNGKLNTEAKVLAQFFQSNPTDFILCHRHECNDDILVMTSTLVQIARLFNMYFLAELSKLSVTQIIGHVAEPLLNIIRCDGWQSATHFDPIVERDLSFESLNGSEWIFTPLAQKEEPKIRSPRASQREKAATDRPQSKQALLYQWLSSNIEMNYASEVKRQQQAIIETRQRQAAFVIPTVKAMPNKRQKNTRNHHYQNIAGIIHDDTFPPSPPSVLTKKRKHGVYQEYNLNLLAEQATQMRGLPISPEISPSPPPFYHQQRLPSIKVMLSELHK